LAWCKPSVLPLFMLTVNPIRRCSLGNLIYTNWVTKMTREEGKPRLKDSRWGCDRKETGPGKEYVCAGAFYTGCMAGIWRIRKFSELKKFGVRKAGNILREPEVRMQGITTEILQKPLQLPYKVENRPKMDNGYLSFHIMGKQASHVWFDRASPKKRPCLILGSYPITQPPPPLTP